MGLPVLAGMSRKGMIHKLLNITANEALNGTTALIWWPYKTGLKFYGCMM